MDDLNRAYVRRDACVLRAVLRAEQRDRRDQRRFRRGEGAGVGRAVLRDDSARRGGDAPGHAADADDGGSSHRARGFVARASPCFAWRGRALGSRTTTSCALNALASVLQGDRSSGLVKALVYDRQLASFVNVAHFDNRERRRVSDRGGAARRDAARRDRRRDRQRSCAWRADTPPIGARAQSIQECECRYGGRESSGAPLPRRHARAGRRLGARSGGVCQAGELAPPTVTRPTCSGLQ